MFVCHDDGVAHAEHERAFAARIGAQPFIRAARRVAASDVHRDQFCAVVEAPTNDAFGDMNRTLMRFVKIRANVQDVLAVGEVTGLPIGLAETHVVRSTLVRRAKCAVVEQRRRTNRVQKARHLLGDARTANLDCHFFGFAFVDGLANARRDVGVRLIPGDTLPLAFTARADPLEREQNALRVSVDRRAGLAFGAQRLAVIRVFRIAANLHQFAVNHVTLNATDGRAIEAHALNDFGFCVVVFEPTLTAGVANGLALTNQLLLFLEGAEEGLRVIRQ